MKFIQLLCIAFVLSFLFYTNNTFAQNTFPSTGAVGIGTTAPDSSSILEIRSTSKGILIPRLTQAKKDAIVRPATGLLIYQINAITGFYYYNGSAWAPLSSTGSNWLLTGNSGTISSKNFVGTTDTEALVFKVNKKLAGYLDYNAALANTGFGYETLGSNTGGGNSAFGYQANFSNTNGYQNTAIGNTALYSNSTGGYNVAVGLAALFTNRGGFSNTAAGQRSMYLNTTGGNNTATGFNALYSNTTGNYNIANGDQAGYDNTTGGTNIFIGQYAGIGSNTGSNNICIGSHATVNNGVSNSVVIGNSVTTASSNVVILGTSSQNVGIGTSSPQQQLSVNNALNIDQIGGNNGVINNGTSSGNGLTFGSGSGEGIASKRTSGGNQNGLDFYTSFANRMAITNAGNVGIGTTTPYTSAQLTVNGGTQYYSIYAENHNTSGGIAINGITDQGAGWGVYGNSTGSTSTDINIGVFGSANGSTFCAAATKACDGCDFFCVDGNYGVYGDAGGDGFAGAFNGDVGVFGNIYSGSNIEQAFAKNAQQLSNALGRLKQLSVQEFDYNQDYAKTNKLNLPVIHQYGFVPENLEKIFPNLVMNFKAPIISQPSKNSKPEITGTTQFFAVNYISFIPLLTKAVQELSTQNDSLKNQTASQQSQINDLQNQLNNLKVSINQMQNAMSQCCSSFSSNMQAVINSQSITQISDLPWLGQNIPNPFNQSTSIQYNLPVKFNAAQILITDYSGKTLKQINIAAGGKGVVNIEAGSLSSGAYNYSLIVDGKLIDTKKMVLTK